MKNFKNLLFKCFILSSIFLFISCSGDDDNNSNNTAIAPSIYGEWKYIAYVENGEYFDDLDACENEIITINEDNTGNILLEDCDFGNQTADFTWENISGNKYSITALGSTRTIFISFPNDDEHMHITEEDDPTYSQVYYRQ